MSRMTDLFTPPTILPEHTVAKTMGNWVSIHNAMQNATRNELATMLDYEHRHKRRPDIMRRLAARWGNSEKERISGVRTNYEVTLW